MKRKSITFLLFVIILSGIVAVFVTSSSRASSLSNQIIEAARNGDTNSVRTLLDSGASPNTREGDADNSTVLMVAAMKGHTEIVVLLASRGADVNAQSNSGRTALMYAAWKGNTSTVQALINSGADANIGDKWQSTALLFAISMRHAETVQALMVKNLDIDATNFFEDNALSYAIKMNDEPLVNFLLAEGANVNAVTSIRNYTPLFVAIDKGNPGIVQNLLDHGANIKHQTRTGESMLMKAQSKGNPNIVRLLMSRGAR